MSRITRWSTVPYSVSCCVDLDDLLLAHSWRERARGEPAAVRLSCDVDKHIGELIERGRGEAGDGLLGELLPGRLEPR